MAAKVRLDHRGIERLLKSSPVQALTHAAAVRVAANLAPDLDVSVDDYTTDRAATSVTITMAKALAAEAKHGHLTRAATAAGLEVRSKS